MEPELGFSLFPFHFTGIRAAAGSVPFLFSHKEWGKGKKGANGNHPGFIGHQAPSQEEDAQSYPDRQGKPGILPKFLPAQLIYISHFISHFMMLQVPFPLLTSPFYFSRYGQNQLRWRNPQSGNLPLRQR